MSAPIRALEGPVKENYRLEKENPILSNSWKMDGFFLAIFEFRWLASPFRSQLCANNAKPNWFIL